MMVPSATIVFFSITKITTQRSSLRPSLTIERRICAA
jgi:hypothetical protein